MAPCGPIYTKNVLKIATITFLAASAFAQASPKYDSATESKLKGVVEQLKLVPPTGKKSLAYLEIKSGEGTVQIFLCPKSFLDDMGVNFKAGEEIQVTGSTQRVGFDPKSRSQNTKKVQNSSINVTSISQLSEKRAV